MQFPQQFFSVDEQLLRCRIQYACHLVSSSGFRLEQPQVSVFAPIKDVDFSRFRVVEDVEIVAQEVHLQDGLLYGGRAQTESFSAHYAWQGGFCRWFLLPWRRNFDLGSMTLDEAFFVLKQLTFQFVQGTVTGGSPVVGTLFCPQQVTDCAEGDFHGLPVALRTHRYLSLLDEVIEPSQ